MIPAVAIVGRPNVGKSTIFNRIVGERIAITDSKPGATRDRIYGKAVWLNRVFSVIDTGGIEISDAPFLSQIRAQAEIAIEESDVICFVTDGQSGLMPDDREVMNLLFQARKPVVIAVNKADNLTLRQQAFEFYEIGVEDVIPVSAAHGIGIGDLLDRLVHYLPEEKPEPYPDNMMKLCVIGRPNVGKSSLVNAILGQDRLIVSEIHGTTTDSIDTLFTFHDQQAVIVDTAGLRKRGKIFESVEKYSALRAMQAIERSDVCLLVLDAKTGIQEQDKHIAGYAIDLGKAMVIVLNKYDTIERTESTMSEWTKKIRQEFQFLSYIPIAFVSAKTKARMGTLFPLIQQAFDNYQKRISTSTLNEVISEAMLINPPKEHNGTLLKVYYATQVKTKCPTFVLFVNESEAIHFSYYRYLENQIRSRFDFEGTPVKIGLRNRE